VLTEKGVRTAEVDGGAGGPDGAVDVPLVAMLAAGEELVAALQEATSKGIVR
jgi:hypothetical protein